MDIGLSQSLMHECDCDTRPMATFSAKDHCHCRLVSVFSILLSESGRLTWPEWMLTR